MKKAEMIVVFLLSFFVLALSFYPIYSRYKQTPPDRVYVGTTFFTQDYAGYVSTIEQGIKGNILYQDKFTTEKVPQTFLYYPYLVIGHIGRIFGISSVWMYHISRFVLGFTYLLTIFWLIKTVFPKSVIKRLLAFLLVLFSSSIPGSRLSGMIAEVQIVNRFVIQPHFLLGNIALVLCLILFLKFLEKPRFKYALISGIIIFLTTIFRPSNMMLFLGVVFVFSIFKRFKTNNQLLITNILFFLPAIIYLFFLQKTIPDLPYFLYDKAPTNPFNVWDFILLEGPVFLILIIGSILVSLRANKVSVAISNWIPACRQAGLRRFTPRNDILILFLFLILNFLSIFFLPKIYPLNPLRFLQTPIFAITAILATGVIFKLSKNIIVISVITIIIFIVSFPTFILDLRHENKLYVDALYIWPPKEYVPALSYLDNKSHPEDKVLTYMSLSNLVPMLSGNTVYWGHGNETLKYNQKTPMVENFYKGKMTEADAQQFLSKNNIKYVLVGDEERWLGTIPKYPFLNRVFENSRLVIYNVAL